MTTYVMRGGRLIDKKFAPPKEGRHGPASFVISDEMEPTRHMANNKMYTSKAKFRQATRDAGCIEVGTETATLLKPRKQIQLDPVRRREEIRRAISEIRNR